MADQESIPEELQDIMRRARELFEARMRSAIEDAFDAAKDKGLADQDAMNAAISITAHLSAETIGILCGLIMERSPMMNPNRVAQIAFQDVTGRAQAILDRVVGNAPQPIDASKIN